MLEGVQMNRQYYLRQSILSHLKKILFIISITFTLFLFIGILTTIDPVKRLSHYLFSHQINKIDDSVYLQLFSLENNSFSLFFKSREKEQILSKTLFDRVTSMSLSDFSSFIRLEIPSYAVYEKKSLLANHQLDHTSFVVEESGPPLENVLENRKAVDLSNDEESEGNEKEQIKSELTTGDKKVVFLYNTHNRESFLPHLPDEENANNAHHAEVNITKVSERLANKLEDYGIGSQADTTDIMNILNKNSWSYGQSYKASRKVVEEALAGNKDIQYIFDIHRDSISRNLSTKKIDGKKYAKTLFVIGKENENYKKNLALAKQLHDSLNDVLPNISRGVVTKEGAGVNGVYNQDLSENAILIEIGGHENTLEEMYQTVDVLAEVFSQLYWDAEKVSK